MIDILGLDTLFAEMVTGLGLALLVGNVLAWRKHRRGEQPRGVEGEFRRGRVAFLLAVGVLLTAWGLASMLSGGTEAGLPGMGSPFFLAGHVSRPKAFGNLASPTTRM